MWLMSAFNATRWERNLSGLPLKVGALLDQPGGCHWVMSPWKFSLKQLLQWSEPTHCLCSGFTQHHCLRSLAKRHHEPPFEALGVITSKMTQRWTLFWGKGAVGRRFLFALPNWRRMSYPVSTYTWCDVIMLDPLPCVLPARTQPNSVSVAASESWLPFCQPWCTTSMKISSLSRTSTLPGLLNSGLLVVDRSSYPIHHSKQ